LRELLIRQKVRRCVICVPPSVVRQWKDEMEERFGLSFVVYEREFVNKVRQSRGFGVNPWKTHNRFIISHALIRDEAYAATLRDWLGDFSGGSLLILDEAHNVAPASGSRYAVDSKLTHTMRDLAPRFEHKLFLSATPHNGHSNSFSALLELLDPQKFCRGVPPKPTLRDQVMVRRLKSDLREVGETFPKRNIARLSLSNLPQDAPELVLSRLLQQYRSARIARLKDASKPQLAAAMLVVTSLQKRLLSSLEAFARTLHVHKESMLRPPKVEPKPSSPERFSLLVQNADADDERADLPEAEVEQEEAAQMQAATLQAQGTQAAFGPEMALLGEMENIVKKYRADPDPRVKQLIAWIKQHQCPNLGAENAAWNTRRVIIFTEYADTKRYLKEQLEAAIAKSERASERIRTFHGGIGDEERELIKAAFNADPTKNPLRILIATDAAREGVNLQNNCYDLFHFDIPWNPGRLEQRNGRIDRKLQQAPEVNCYYFVLEQRAEDRVLDVLVEKTKVIQEQLGSLSPVIAQRFDALLQRGISHDQADQLAASIRSADKDEDQAGAKVSVLKDEMGDEMSLPRRQKLEKSLASLRQLLDKSRVWLGLDDRHFRDAISASLTALGAAPLSPFKSSEAAATPDKARWVIPKLHERYGADPSWATTLDALRKPRPPKQSLAEWRRDAPIRPVVFSDPGNLDGEVVHLHLEHRVVQRLLGRFMSLGFREDDLSRACVLLSKEPVPRLVLLARLSLYGEGGARLHDELVASAALWVTPEQRGKSRLESLNEKDKESVLRLVEEAFATPSLRNAEPALLDYLRQFTERDIQDLTQPLEARARELQKRAERELQKRAEAEAKAMREILETQRASILEQQAKLDKEPDQLSFHFTQDEQRQLANERKYWVKRLQDIKEELETEPERVRRSYAVKASRTEPVGLVYLWPHSR
jgi:superfamily II DNA/RNA helicase